MKKTLTILNQLEADGYYQRYAIGGAIAALFYMEPFETEDLDVFVLLPPADINPLTPLTPIYEELRRLGYKEDGPYIIIEGLPVQLLPAYNRLVEEAVTDAVEVEYDSVSTRVPRAEYLAAIMIQTGRPKDRLRFEGLRNQVNLNHSLLSDIVDSHNLTERYQEWVR